MQTLLLVFELKIAIALVVFVLLQRSEGGGLGIGGGSSMGGLFTPRGAADTLTRTTAILAVLFFVTCIGLDLLSGQPGISTPESLLSGPGTAPVQQPLRQAPVPVGPQVPKPR